MATQDESTKSGDKPIEHLADEGKVDAAEKAYVAEQEQAAQDRLYDGDALTYTEYDAIGKGKNYKPKDEIKASLAAKDQAVKDAAANVNNMTPEEREARKAEARESREARKSENEREREARKGATASQLPASTSSSKS